MVSPLIAGAMWGGGDAAAKATEQGGLEYQKDAAKLEENKAQNEMLANREMALQRARDISENARLDKTLGAHAAEGALNRTHAETLQRGSFAHAETLQKGSFAHTEAMQAALKTFELERDATRKAFDLELHSADRQSREKIAGMQVSATLAALKNQGLSMQTDASGNIGTVDIKNNTFTPIVGPDGKPMKGAKADDGVKLIEAIGHAAKAAADAGDAATAKRFSDALSVIVSERMQRNPGGGGAVVDPFKAAAPAAKAPGKTAAAPAVPGEMTPGQALRASIANTYDPNAMIGGLIGNAVRKPEEFSPLP